MQNPINQSWKAILNPETGKWEDQEKYILVYNTGTNYCKHNQNGWYDTFKWWIFSWEVYWCEDCHTLFYGKKLKELKNKKPGN